MECSIDLWQVSFCVLEDGGRKGCACARKFVTLSPLVAPLDIGTSGGNRSLTMKRKASTTTNKIIVVVSSACQFSISLFSHFQRFDNDIF